VAFSLVLVIALGSTGGPRSATHGGSRRTKPSVIIASLDGVPFSLVIKEKPTFLSTGNLTRRIPVYPTQTIVNHWSIATGVEPVVHGIVANHFDLAYSTNGTGIFTAAQQKEQAYAWQRVPPVWNLENVTACIVGWPGLDAVPPVHGGSVAFVPNQPCEDRIASLVMLNEQYSCDVSFIYLSEAVDNAGHVEGDSAAALRLADACVEELAVATPWATSRIVVSDHGMVPVTGYHLVPNGTSFAQLGAVAVDGPGIDALPGTRVVLDNHTTISADVGMYFIAHESDRLPLGKRGAHGYLLAPGSPQELDLSAIMVSWNVSDVGPVANSSKVAEIVRSMFS
jgi:hypothetical protein